jgi:hypothetical protein
MVRIRIQQSKFRWIQNDNSSKNTGFRGNDYVAKFRVNSDADAKYINR